MWTNPRTVSKLGVTDRNYDLHKTGHFIYSIINNNRGKQNLALDSGQGVNTT